MTTSVAFSLENLSCASCVGRAEAALAAVDGVRDAHANLANGAARVTFSGPDANVAAAADALANAGYPARQDTTVINVTGLSCASCVGRAERALIATPGVLNAAVSLADAKARVTFLEGTTSAAELANALTQAGYPSQVPSDGTPAPDHANTEADALRRHALTAALLTLPVFLLEMGGHAVPALHHWIAQTIGTQNSWILQFFLTTAVLAGPGRQFFTRGIPALLRGAPDMNALVAIGAAAAWGYSTVATFAPTLLPEGSRAVYFEAAAMIVALILLGRTLEARAKGRAGEAIRALVRLRPDTAQVRRDGAFRETPVAEIRTGDVFLVRPGERLATDGTIVEGSSFVDESMISGEPEPVQRGEGDDVLGGTVNTTGALTVRATHVGADTVLARITALVEDAQAARLPVQDMVNRITLWFVPAVLVLALLTVMLWLLFGPAPALPHALVAGVSVLIIACPCAMGLAVPTSIMVGSGRAAQLGVLFRKGDALQRLSGVQTIALDKTGTVTEGRPRLTHIATTDDWSETQVLALAAAAETRSEHPIATAIVGAAETRGLAMPLVAAFQAKPGAGAVAQVDGQEVRVGTLRYLEDSGVDLNSTLNTEAHTDARRDTRVLVAVGGVLAGQISVADPVKPRAANALRKLRDLGLRLVMVTGDSTSTAEAVAAEVGIDVVIAETTPDGKVAAVEEMRATHAGGLAFVGDGINDAPALATADVGIAIGTGTDVAIESADVVLVSGDLTGVATAVEISQRTMANIRQNLMWAFGYNTLLIPVAAGALYPINGLLLSPVLAAAAMAASSVLVVANALRLRTIGNAPPPQSATPEPQPAE